MRKLTKVEASIIQTALILWREQFQKEVRAVEKKGKNAMFSEEYPVMMEKEINDKLESLTLKTKG